MEWRQRKSHRVKRWNGHRNRDHDMVETSTGIPVVVEGGRQLGRWDVAGYGIDPGGAFTLHSLVNSRLK